MTSGRASDASDGSDPPTRRPGDRAPARADAVVPAIADAVVRAPGVRALGVDLGSKRIGIAISDSGGSVASPLTTLHRSKSKRHDHGEIARLVLAEEATIVVVGLPLSLDGSTGPAARSAISETERLASVVDVPVEMYDERFTTVTAERAMLEAGLRAPDRRKVVDKVAAAVMLQSWLDRRRHAWITEHGAVG